MERKEEGTMETLEGEEASASSSSGAQTVLEIPISPLKAVEEEEEKEAESSTSTLVETEEKAKEEAIRVEEEEEKKKKEEEERKVSPSRIPKRAEVGILKGVRSRTPSESSSGARKKVWIKSDSTIFAEGADVEEELAESLAEVEISGPVRASTPKKAMSEDPDSTRSPEGSRKKIDKKSLRRVKDWITTEQGQGTSSSAPKGRRRRPRTSQGPSP